MQPPYTVFVAVSTFLGNYHFLPHGGGGAGGNGGGGSSENN